MTIVMNTARPILAAIPIPYHDGEAFWSRDMGLTVRGLRSLGVDARLVALGRREDHAADLPLILGSREDFGKPDWWRQWQPAGVILTAWSASRYNDIRRAVLATTPHVIERLDTDGVRSPRIWLWHYALQSFNGRLDAGRPLERFIGPALTFLDVLAGCWIIGRRIADAMSLMPALTAESPIAVERIRRLIRFYHPQAPRMHCIPHPVAEEYMRFDPGIARKNRIVSVGRWHTRQKNFPLLLAVLEAFLTHHPDWEADIIGQLPAGWRPETCLRPELRARLRFHGVKPHREIAAIYQQSKIFLMTSRYESFNIAAAEALCCGCSAVGPVEIASVPYFTSEASGTVVCRQTCNHFLDALGTEVQAWETGRRNPEIISRKWLATVGSTAVAKQFLECLESIGPTEPNHSP